MKKKLTPEEAVSYIENYGWSTTKLGLERTRGLFDALGNPQKELKFIHVAGSNGKGSTCAMLAAILMEAGYKTGLYISPYIEEFNERIQINGEHIPGERLAEITERVMEIADSMEDHPSQFELVTAIGIEYFYQEGCDIVVLEVGMGGALDSTNAIDAPEVAVITNIGLEHTEYLGDSLEGIARTKGGIIKPGCSCVCYEGNPEVTEIIEEICRENNVPFTLAEYSSVEPMGSSLDGQRFKYISSASDETYEIKEDVYTLSLLGEHQLRNVAVVLETLNVLRLRGWSIKENAISKGLEKVEWPARFEVLSRNPLFILDGGHNPQCAEALCKTIEEYLPNEKVIFMLGVLGDKDYETIIDMVLPYGEDFVCVTPLSDRALPALELKGFVEAKGAKAYAAENLFQGIKAAHKLSVENGDSPIIVFGSLYLAGAVRKEFKRANRSFFRLLGVSGRNTLTEEERVNKSQAIVDRIKELPDFKEAKNIMIYKWTKGEVKLDAFETTMGENQSLLYPLPVDDEGNMIAIKPGEGKDAWKEGLFGIFEPVKENGDIIAPEDIDLIICPLSAFDEDCNRLGMGKGYYDRFLPKCINAKKIGVAFEVQKIKKVPAEPFDYVLEMIVTEDAIYSPRP